MWFSRAGQRLGTLETPTVLRNPTLSPDEKLLAAQSSEAYHGGEGVWLVDLAHGASTRVAEGTLPVWAPDGAHIAFTSGRTAGIEDVYTQSTTGRNEDAVLLRTAETKKVHGWSPDGRYLIYVSSSPHTKQDLWLLPMFGDRTPRPFLQTVFNEMQGQVSPDGRWIAYTSDESGAWEVYVQSFPELGGKRTISVGGGKEPQWRHDGKELFYLAANETLMTVEVTPADTWQAKRPTVLFRARLPPGAPPRNHYAVTADGQRFVVDVVDEPDREQPMTVPRQLDRSAKSLMVDDRPEPRRRRECDVQLFCLAADDTLMAVEVAGRHVAGQAIERAVSDAIVLGCGGPESLCGDRPRLTDGHPQRYPGPRTPKRQSPRQEC